LQNTPNGLYPVLPIDIFPLGIGASMLGDGDFVNSDSFSGQLGGDLRLEPKAVFLDRNGLKDLSFDRFVAGLHVGKVEIGKHVG
jgi:hypothetical protein